jgi:hypothetical protein
MVFFIKTFSRMRTCERGNSPMEIIIKPFACVGVAEEIFPKN